MSRGVLAALLLALAAPAAAGWRSFAASEPGACAGGLFVFSDDGWHYACAQKGAGPDVLLRNGVPVATLKPSQLSGQFPHESAMSENGRVILHQLAVMDEQGTVTGVQAAVNGSPIGPVCSDIGFLALTDQGADLAYSCKRPEGWRVVTAAATGPALPVPPSLVGLGVTGRVAYLVQPPQGAARLYINHAPVPEQDLYQAYVSPDLKRRVVYRAGTEFEGVKVDPGSGQKPQGPWKGAGALAFAADGRRYAYPARRLGDNFDTIVLNGDAYACENPAGIASTLGYSAYALFSPKGDAAWVCEVKGKDGLHTLFLEGKPLANFSSHHWPKAAFTPGGRPGVLVTKKDGTGAALTGAGAAIGLPKPLPGASVGFDAEDEFHYYARVDGQVALVCAAFGGKEPRACAAKARKLYRGQ